MMTLIESFLSLGELRTAIMLSSVVFFLYLGALAFGQIVLFGLMVARQRSAYNKVAGLLARFSAPLRQL